MKSIGLILIVLLGFSASAQLVVKGVVKDAETSETLPFVKVVFNKGPRAITDFEGKFEIQVSTLPDTATVTYVGYETARIEISQADTGYINISMRPANTTLNTVEITPGKNPAFKVLDSIRMHRKANDAANLSAIEYQQYNKFQFGINNLSDEFGERKFLQGFSFITDYVDTTAGKNTLPILLTESVSKIYLKNNPRQRKEVILGSHITGVDNLNLEQFTQDINKEINFYQNQIALFGRDFTSPLSYAGKTVYKYYKLQNDTLNGEICIHLSFKPKRTGDPVFDGDLWVSEADFGLRKIDLIIPDNVNLNYVSDFSLEQEYTPTDSNIWVMTASKIEARFTLRNESKKEDLKTVQVIKSGHKTGIVTHQPHMADFYFGEVEVAEDATNHAMVFWDSIRPVNLSKQEAGVVEMIDSLKQNKTFKLYDQLSRTVLSGYWEAGKVEVGYLYSLYNRNDVEGSSVKFNLRTSKKFSKYHRLSSFIGYGFKDREFKYGLGYDWIFDKPLPESVHFSYSKSMEQLGRTVGAGSSNNPFANLFTIQKQNKLTMVDEFKLTYNRQYTTPFRSSTSMSLRQLTPVGVSNYQVKDSDGGITHLDNLVTFEVRNQVTFSKKERFIKINGRKMSLGSPIPVLSVAHTFGIKDVLTSGYNYNRFDFNLAHRPKLGRFGKLRYSVYAGKVLGNAPYPFLNIHSGNESYYMEISSFNLANYYEFISDTWVGFNFQHQLQGLVMDRIPLVNKLKWRLVYGAKAVAGSYAGKSNVMLPDYSHTLSFTKPYAEASVGIENIFKVLRVDAIWRLTYLDHPNATKFGVRFRFVGNF